MELNQDIFDEFKAVSKKDIRLFFNKALAFFAGGFYTDLSNYYSGKSETITSAPYVLLKQLEEEVAELYQIFSTLQYRLNNYKWWMLLDEIEEIDNRLKTTRNINKWSRSTATSVNYSPQQEINYTLKQNDTLEKVAINVLSSTNAQDEWVDIAMRNNLIEEGYNVDGGKSIKARVRQNGINSFNIISVVDVISEQTINGKDVLREITIEDDDLKTVTGLDCAIQSTDILIQLKKNDNPDAPQDGLQMELAVGGNRATLNFPIISRQLKDTFATDDSLKNFAVLNVGVDQDNLAIKYSIETRLGEIISEQSSI